MAKLTGTSPDQVPTNADLGTMAYQDATDVKLGNLRVEGDSGSQQVRLGTSDGYLEINSFSSNPTYAVFGGSNITQGAFGTQGNIDLSLLTNNTERMRIDSAGDVDIANELIAGSYNETYSALSGTSPTVNCEAGNSFSLTLSGNTTFTFSNPPASGTSYTFSIEIIQDASASGYTVTWPASVDWPAATAPTLTATASAKDIFVFTTRDGGTNWYGFTAGQALA